MSNDKGYIIQEPLGWRVLPDGCRVALAFRTAGQQEISLAFDKDGLRKLLLCAIDGTAAFPLQKGLQNKEIKLIATNWFEIGRIAGSDDLSLSLFREGGANLTFRIDRVMAERILEALTLALGKAVPVPGGPPVN